MCVGGGPRLRWITSSKEGEYLPEPLPEHKTPARFSCDRRQDGRCTPTDWRQIRGYHSDPSHHLPIPESMGPSVAARGELIPRAQGNPGRLAGHGSISLILTPFCSRRGAHTLPGFRSFPGTQESGIQAAGGAGQIDRAGPLLHENFSGILRIDSPRRLLSDLFSGDLRRSLTSDLRASPRKPAEERALIILSVEPGSNLR
ncbi:MAG: hypothetical protein METHP_00767 [Methanoregula sp. SKADARSKE-2]|nr:MAG: hypothetical protein METHP_00767 [Methanoregula sp. SKADARSKE-2]